MRKTCSLDKYVCYLLPSHSFTHTHTLSPPLSPLIQESDLVYQVKDLELIEQHDHLEGEIRQRLAQEDAGKTDMQRLEEEAMINELVELVEKRDRLLWDLHLEKTL